MIDLLLTEWLGTSAWMWIGFLALVALLLAIDLGVVHRKEHEIGVAESLATSAVYIALGLAFGGFVWWYMGSAVGMNYFTGFVVEKSLAMDNVFVIAMIFTYFGVPRLYQHRVLFWGVLGAIVLRAIMIGLGAALIERFDWVLYLFAGFLIFTGVKMWLLADKEYDVAGNPVLKFVRRHLRVADRFHEQHFFVTLPDAGTGRSHWHMTPLMLALLMVEIVDVVFAVDSVPAIFAITTDPFIVYTSNIFAILGLRALYFALAAMVDRFHYLKYALSVLLVFIGSKVFVADALGLTKIPPAASLLVTFAILAAGVAVSLWRTRSSIAQKSRS
jgi:tellurite resistance protein TerC